ncbi:MAG: ATP-binding protein [Candidatus Eremiobacteraeota bacterium]|nr:ATP-binding protein [Candidatus Eremiobacteraeota bacterium]
MAAELATQNPDYVHFSVDASHISRLGRELVARRETALAELVKNAYDADATRVWLTFNKAEAPGGALEIRDNGDGMTRSELVGGFMRVSTPIKIDEPLSRRRGRQRAGSKGIGRFALQRLADKVLIKTKPANGSPAFEVTIDWSMFEPHRELTAIPSRITASTKKMRGTKLILSPLREAWTAKDIEKTILHLAPLVQPFPVNLKGQASLRKAEDFQILIATSEKEPYQPVQHAYDQFFEAALAKITGWVNKTARGSYVLKCSRFKIDERFDLAGQYERAEGIRFEAYYYIRSSEFIPSVIGKALREVLSEQGGIRIYRNGFRVLPYGEKGNDWLRLDEEYRKRAKLLDPIGNTSFLGFVEINDPRGERFEETSSREGLIDNQSFSSLRGFVFDALYDAVKRVSTAKAREKSKIVVPTGFDINSRLRHVVRRLDSYRMSPTPKTAVHVLSEIDTDIRALTRDFRKLDKARIDELGTLRILSSLGISLAEFMHEVRQAISLILSDLGKLLRRVKDERARELLQRLQGSSRLLRSYTDFYDSIITANEDRAIRPREMHLATREFRQLASPIAEDQRTSVSIVSNLSEKAYSRPMHRSEWLAIFLNLFSNSLKAIDRARPEQGKIEITLDRVGRNISIDFLDNGDGIDKAMWTDVFLPFVSTSRRSESSLGPDDVTGMGMGLKIVRDIIQSNGGTIQVVEPPVSWSTCIHIEVPSATERQIEDASE